MVGSDIEALYPSLDAVEVAQIVFNAMMKSFSFNVSDWRVSMTDDGC